jgi:hypothetical protein
MPRPRCGNDPRAQLTDGDRQAIADFRAYLTRRAQEKTVPTPRVQATRYVVSCFEPDDHEGAAFNLTVEYRGRGLWAVLRGGFCLGSDGTWSYESIPSEREDEWLATHRFDLDTALNLAKEHAPKVKVNGFTVADALRMADEAQP